MNTTKINVEKIKAAVGSIPDFPKKGILFRDMMPILRDPQLLNQTIEYFYEQVKDLKPKYIVGIESRGFILGAPLAMRLGCGFVPVRKTGKLPGLVEKHEYDLEYGSDVVEIQHNAVEPGARVVVMDDLLATGGTCGAACTLLDKVNADVVAILFLIELEALKGRERLPQKPQIHSMIQY